MSLFTRDEHSVFFLAAFWDVRLFDAIPSYLHCRGQHAMPTVCQASPTHEQTRGGSGRQGGPLHIIVDFLLGVTNTFNSPSPGVRRRPSDTTHT